MPVLSSSLLPTCAGPSILALAPHRHQQHQLQHAAPFIPSICHMLYVLAGGLHRHPPPPCSQPSPASPAINNGLSKASQWSA
uniref:Uncharacterized protein n=1 Tax=Arundo donax TaxID=35708 RepID=A0A0A9A028_ARUDO